MTIVALSDRFALNDFDCGVPERNAWLRARALPNTRADDTRTYLAVRGEQVVGFHALSLAGIVREHLPAAALRKNTPVQLGAVLLAQLATDVSVRGQGVGRRLVLHAMTVAVTVADLAGSRLFATHPASETLDGYYERFGFTLVPGVSPRLMVMTMATVRRTLAAVAG